MVSVAVAIAFGDVSASTFVNLSRPVADATSVVRAHAVVDVVTDAIGIGVRRAVATTDTQGVELVPVAVAIAFGDVGASAFVDVARSVADATRIELAHAVVDVVTDAIGIGVRRAVATTDTQGVELVPVAVAIAFRDVGASALVDFTRTVANAAGVKLVSVAVTVSFGEVCAPALVDFTRAVADATRVVRTHAVVDVITNAVLVEVGRARATAHPEGVDEKA